jgi:CRP-like cAMP-binding protein
MDSSTCQTVPLLAGCSAEEARQGLKRFQRLNVEAGGRLITESHPGRQFFLVVSGTMAVSRGGRFVRLLAGPTFVGEEAMLGLGPRSATVQALTKCEVLATGQLGFDELMRLPGVGRQIAATVAGRLRERDGEGAAATA